MEAETMDMSRFDGLTRNLATTRSRRAALAGLVIAALGGSVAEPFALEAVAKGKCPHGKRNCGAGCCPRRADVCCKKYCCKKGYRCCGHGKCCRK